MKVENKVSKKENEETKKQNEDFESLKKQKEKADLLAKEKQKQLQQQEIENKKIEEERKKQAASLAASAIGVIGSQAKKKPTFKSFLIGLILGLVIGFLIATFIGKNNNVIDLNENQNIQEGLISHTEVDFENVILGEVKQHQELIVMEQPLEVSSTITKTGLANLDIFAKTKNISYSGKGLYTTDLSKIDSNHINVDQDNKTVYINIPHTILQEVILDVDNITFEDTEKGILAFGELKLTLEEENEIERSVKETMRKTLDTKDMYEQADEFAKLKTWQIFQPLVSAVASEYVVEMIFD